MSEPHEIKQPYHFLGETSSILQAATPYYLITKSVLKNVTCIVFIRKRVLAPDEKVIFVQTTRAVLMLYIPDYPTCFLLIRM